MCGQSLMWSLSCHTAGPMDNVNIQWACGRSSDSQKSLTHCPSLISPCAPGLLQGWSDGLLLFQHWSFPGCAGRRPWAANCSGRMPPAVVLPGDSHSCSQNMRGPWGAEERWWPCVVWVAAEAGNIDLACMRLQQPWWTRCNRADQRKWFLCLNTCESF